MFLYFDQTGRLLEIVNDEALRQQNSDINTIYIYLEGADPSTDTFNVDGTNYKRHLLPTIFSTGYIRFKLPDGTVTNQGDFDITPVNSQIPYYKRRDLKYFKDFDYYQFYKIELPTGVDEDGQPTVLPNVLEQEGLVACTVSLVKTAGGLFALGLITFNVEESVVQEESPITLSQWNYLINALRLGDWDTIIPKVPYEGATRDVNIGEHTLYTIGGISHPGEQGYPYISFVNGTFTFTPNATDNTYVIANSTLNYLEIDDVRNGLEYVFPNQSGTLALKSQVDAVAEMANGKTNTFVVYYAENFATIQQTLNNDILCGAILFDGTNYTDITENIKGGTTYNVYNPQLNSQANQLTLYQSYLVVRTNYSDSKYNLSGFSQYSHTIYLFIDYNYPKAGDNVYIVETDVPDRWVSGKFAGGGLTFNKMETAKIDLSNYVDLTSNQTITGPKTFSNTVRFTGSIYGTNYNETFDDIYTTINNTIGVSLGTEIKWSKTLTFSKSADTTFTFETPKLNCLNEYKAFITNGGSSSIVLTFTGVNNILCNDDNCVVSGNTLTLPSGTTIEINCMNNNLVAINWSAQ